MRIAIRRDIRLHMLAVDDLREHARIAIILDPAVDGFDHEHPLSQRGTDKSGEQLEATPGFEPG